MKVRPNNIHSRIKSGVKIVSIYGPDGIINNVESDNISYEWNNGQKFNILYTEFLLFITNETIKIL